MEEFKRIADATADLREALASHSLHDQLTSLPRLRRFMEHHVFAVWDFMSLLTRLQRDLTGTTVPWLPSPYPAQVVRFVNEIKLGEECDDVPGWGVTSHLDLYRMAMSEAGADCIPFDAVQLVLGIRPASDLPAVMAAVGAPAGAVRFTSHTMRVAIGGTLPEVAASFCLGRETLIPDLFRPLLDAHPECDLFDRYLRRHIEVDGGEHGPAAEELLEAVCETFEDWQRAESAAITALAARCRLWSDVVASLPAG